MVLITNGHIGSKQRIGADLNRQCRSDYAPTTDERARPNTHLTFGGDLHVGLNFGVFTERKGTTGDHVDVDAATQTDAAAHAETGIQAAIPKQQKRRARIAPSVADRAQTASQLTHRDRLSFSITVLPTTLALLQGNCQLGDR